MKTHRTDTVNMLDDRRRILLQTRRGSLLPVMTVHMTILSVLMGICGLCLHTVLKSDRSERSVILLLNSLGRMEQQLRIDQSKSVVDPLNGSAMTLRSAESTQIHWSINRGVVSREERTGEVVMQRERYIFPAGTQIAFVQSQPYRVLVRIEEPSPFVRYPEAGHGGAVMNKPEAVALPAAPVAASKSGVIEIHLRMKPDLAGGAT